MHVSCPSVDERDEQGFCHLIYNKTSTLGFSSTGPFVGVTGIVVVVDFIGCHKRQNYSVTVTASEC